MGERGERRAGTGGEDRRPLAITLGPLLAVTWSNQEAWGRG